MLKKSVAMLVVLIMVFALAACGGSDTTDISSTSGTTTDVESVISKDADATESQAESEEAGSKAESEETKSEGTKSEDESQAASSTPGLTLSTGSKVESGNNQQGTTSVGAATNQSNEKNITAAYKDLKVKSGKSVTKDLNFGGKTFTMAITEEGQYHTQSFKRTITAFEKKYNCKIKLVEYSFSEYNKQVYQAISAGNAPEICYAHGSMFPGCAIDGLYNDLTDYIVKDDLMDDNNPAAGGIDLAKTSYFVYNKKFYGLCNYESCFPVVIYYNKLAMADAGFSGNNDPRARAEAGKWTWQYILQMGRKLTDKSQDVYALSNGFSGRSIMLSYGAPFATVNNGKYTQNVTSEGYIAGLELIQDMFCGANAIAEPRRNDDDGQYPYNTYDRMLKGKTYLFTEETSKYLDMAKDVSNSIVFGRSKNNIGVTTMPLGSTNKKKLYPTGWLTAVCSGKGTDERVAVAWETFRSSYVDPAASSDKNAFSTADQKFVDGLLAGGICCEVGNFKTSSEDAQSRMRFVAQEITQGADISQKITAVKDQITACIKATVK